MSGDNSRRTPGFHPRIVAAGINLYVRRALITASVPTTKQIMIGQFHDGRSVIDRTLARRDDQILFVICLCVKTDRLREQKRNDD